jgi:hypothetical protein
MEAAQKISTDLLTTSERVSRLSGVSEVARVTIACRPLSVKPSQGLIDVQDEMM